VALFVPERGDLIWLMFNPQAGHEQAGHRPALVLSPRSYNQRSGLALLCPITSQVKGYPFEVLLPAALDIGGAILADQIKSLDWKARKATRAGHVSSAVIADVLSRLSPLLFLS
jgi:mRNA interferase MazF